MTKAISMVKLSSYRHLIFRLLMMTFKQTPGISEKNMTDSDTHTECIDLPTVLLWQDRVHLNRYTV